jgi:hypothetical protein
MKNRILYSCKKLTKRLSKSIDELNSISKLHKYSNESFVLLKTICQKSYAKGLVTESEFVTLLSMLGKNVNEFNKKGYIEKSIIWFFAEIMSNQL